MTSMEKETMDFYESLVEEDYCPRVIIPFPIELEKVREGVTMVTAQTEFPSPKRFTDGFETERVRYRFMADPGQKHYDTMLYVKELGLYQDGGVKATGVLLHEGSSFFCGRDKEFRMTNEAMQTYCRWAEETIDGPQNQMKNLAYWLIMDHLCEHAEKGENISQSLSEWD